MNILFFTIYPYQSNNHNFYTDLLDEFVLNGHSVTLVVANEQRYKGITKIKYVNGMRVLYVKTGNLTDSPFWEKGWANMRVSEQFKAAIQRYLNGDTFDLIMTLTPSVTLSGLWRWAKQRYSAKTYLLLKDMWPQAMVDLKIILPYGPRYQYFAMHERRLYQAADYIGCMSPAQCDFLKRHASLPANCIVEENPNSIRIRKVNKKKDRDILSRYGIPQDKCVFIYGGNFGKPQGLGQFFDMLEGIENGKAFFLFVGKGAESFRVRKFARSHDNAKYINFLPKDEYERLCESADVGLVLLDNRYTTPNIPSRLLSYLENRLPILCAVDASTDVGDICEKAGCGIKTIHGDVKEFNDAVNRLVDNAELRISMGNAGFELLKKRYTVQRSYNIIMKHFKEDEVDGKIKTNNG